MQALPRPLLLNIVPVCDCHRHLICTPYSIKNLHAMADSLGIKRCWFHKDHYDIPLKHCAAILRRCKVVRNREIVQIISKAQSKP
jgi:hypothetical protein